MSSKQADEKLSVSPRGRHPDVCVMRLWLTETDLDLRHGRLRLLPLPHLMPLFFVLASFRRRHIPEGGTSGA